MAVAIWDHKPTPDELLDDRLRRGWSPTPTETVAGLEVQGFAACVFQAEHGAHPKDAES